MTVKTTSPFGLWPSPITPASLAQSLRLSDVAWDSDGETLVWLEGRADQGVLVCSWRGQAPRDLTSTLSVRARVGYGGGDYAVANGVVYFVAQEGRLYRQSLASGEAQPITPQFGHMASPTPSPDGRWVVYVYTHEGEDGLGIVDATGKAWPQKLMCGQDFYMHPCWHPDGTRVAWISWDHPNMPWYSTALKMAYLDTTAQGPPIVTQVETLAEGPDIATSEPRFSPSGSTLAYLSDESGWSNLYLYDLQTRTHRPLTSNQADIGRPAWVQGIRSYAFSPGGRHIYTIRSDAGFDSLWIYDLSSGQARELDLLPVDYTNLSQIAVDPVRGRLVFLASSSTTSPQVVSYSSEEEIPVRVHRRSTGEAIPSADLSKPQPVSWAAGDGTTVHGLYYPPAGSRSPTAGLPPAVISVHGGPTGQASAAYNPRAQFFATRGYAYLDVNYRGSTGYGKRYMAALRSMWGILDVEDAVGAAHYLVEARLADPKRLVIMGGSAGGYTVLQTLVTHPGVFKAALCMYGVSNLFTLAADTHKFEARYLDSLIGPLPQDSALYRDRSPIFHASKIVDPIAVFQGEIDRVVPKAQSETIVASLRRQGIPHEYHVYEGEGHGWRKKETIEAFYKAVEAFLRQHVIFA